MDEYLSDTRQLMNHVYWFRQDLQLKPKRLHYGSAITYTDISIRQHDFISELHNTVSAWVYSKKKAKEIVVDRTIQSGGSEQNAWAFLTNAAAAKFRPGHPQGQFGELLLFNLIQHYFRAVPLLRKQRITTNNKVERFGADAIHYRFEGGSHILFLGEAKCYESKYSFSKAFEKSLASIENTFCSFSKELDLYVYDDFIEPELEQVAKDYKSNQLPNVKFELICLVAYNESEKITSDNEMAIKENIKSAIEKRCSALSDSTFDDIDETLLARLNYIIFPFWNLDKILEDFGQRVGSNVNK